MDLRIDGYTLKDFIGIPPFYALLRFISSSSSLHRIFRFQNFWQPKQQSMNRQQSESPLLLLLLVCWFHLVFYSTDCSAGLNMQKSTADVHKSRASPPATAFGACTQQLLCRVNPKYSRVQSTKCSRVQSTKYSRAILLLVVTLLAINQRDAGSWVNQRHQISDVKVLFQIVVNQRRIICDVKVFKHNKNLSATRSIFMGVKLFIF